MILNKFSYSSLSLYEHCPFCYYLKYVVGVKQEIGSSNLIIGNVVHSYMEDNNVNVGELIDKQIEQYKEIDGLNNNGIREEVFKLVELINNNPLKRENGELININRRELEIYVPINEFVLQVIIDGLSDREEIIDHKTASREYTEEYISTLKQHKLYELGYRQYFGRRSGGIFYDVLYKSKYPLRKLIPVKVSDGEIAYTKNWALRLMRKIKNQEWTPTHPINNLHKSWCDYKNLCPHCAK